MRGQPDAPLRVLLVDTDPHARRVIARELMDDPRTVVVGQAGSLREGLRLVRDTAFDVLLVEARLQDGCGSDLIAPARLANTGAEVIVLSRAGGEEEAFKAFDLGAAGYLSKNCWFMSCVEAVLQVANGGAAITPALSRRLLRRLRRKGDPPAATARSGETVRLKLTPREHEVLRMVARGLTSSEISVQLNISCTTVNSHLKNLYEKLEAHTRAQAISCAISRGFL
jgi:DNA-binding NarL/FixJ family response regulator